MHYLNKLLTLFKLHPVRNQKTYFMKKLVIFLVAIMPLGLSGCRFFKKPAVENVSAIKADSSSVQDSMPDESVFTAVQQEYQPVTGAISGNYYMIVGCFTERGNAESYASALRQKGYNTSIIPGRDNMHMVSVQSYNDYNTSIADISKYRNEVTAGAWVHVAR